VTTTDIKPNYKVFEKLVKNSNLTINRVCKDLGFSSTTIYEWRDGRSSPKAYKLVIMSEYFGVEVKDFFEDE